jgi:hypothetical protein
MTVLIRNAELMQIRWQKFSSPDFLVTEPRLCEQKLLQFRTMIGSFTRDKEVKIRLCKQKIILILSISNDTP